MTLNSNGINSEIIAHILPDEKMYEIGFTDNMPDRWYYCKRLIDDKFGGITFNVVIPKDGSDLDIEILDEGFLQPYDYQIIRSVSDHPSIADEVFEKVESEMKYLEDAGIFSGHEYGEYI